MTPVPTTDHDANIPPLYVGDVGHLARVLLDGRRWELIRPGDPIAEHLMEKSYSQSLRKRSPADARGERRGSVAGNGKAH